MMNFKVSVVSMAWLGIVSVFVATIMMTARVVEASADFQNDYPGLFSVLKSLVYVLTAGVLFVGHFNERKSLMLVTFTVSSVATLSTHAMGDPHGSYVGLIFREHLIALIITFAMTFAFKVDEEELKPEVKTQRFG